MPIFGLVHHQGMSLAAGYPGFSLVVRLTAGNQVMFDPASLHDDYCVVGHSCHPALPCRALRMLRSAPHCCGGSGTGGVVRVRTGDKPAERCALRLVPKTLQAVFGSLPLPA